jgi:HAD superfamily hydrolase (TIGR01490 family)
MNTARLPDPAPPVAFFDLDRTLIDVNSGRLFAQFEFEKGRISARQLAKALVWSLGYHLSLIDLPAAYEQALAHYRGVPEQRIKDRTRVWFERDIVHRLLPQAAAAVRWHRQQGHRLVILSNTSCWQAELATEAWGFDDWLANTFELDAAGCLTGKIDDPMCYAAGKIEHAQRWLDLHGGTLADSWFYSDSLSDAPMLAAVGYPVVINPDPRLRRMARRRGWRTEMWSA